MLSHVVVVVILCGMASSVEALAATSYAPLQKIIPFLPKDFNAVEAGGWYQLLQPLAKDTSPKQQLVQLLQQQQADGAIENKDSVSREHVLALCALLYAQHKGYDSNMIDGEWSSVLSQQAKQSPKIQKLIASKEQRQATFANFNVKKGQFYGNVKLLFGQGDLRSTVQFLPVSDNFSISSEGKIVLRRLACDIVGASWKFWKLPRIPLPLKKKGGYLDVWYLDSELRVTKGNRGGLFVHVRPDVLESWSK